MKVKGLSQFQRSALKKILAEENVSGDFEIEFNDLVPVSLNRMHSLWYGGNMVSIKYKGYTFHIDAAGEVRAYLYLKSSGNRLCYVKDKTNGGYFSSEMTPYFRSDKTLYKLIDGKHLLYDLSLHNTNWWECFLTDPQGKFHDIMWALSDDNLFSAVAEALGSLEEKIKYIEEDSAS